MGPKWILGGGGTVGCRLAEIDKGWGAAENKQVLLSATDPHTASSPHQSLWGKLWGKNKKHQKVLDLLDNLAEAQSTEVLYTVI